MVRADIIEGGYMVRIALIAMYFGKLPEYTRLFFESAKHNTDIDFILFTDQNVKNDSNIHVIKVTFDQMRDLIQSKFNFKVSLEKPYKLCDFRPAFGYIFSEYLKKYDYWGHCDLDMVFGDVLKYIKRPIQLEYDKIFQNGHLTLYKNTNTINKAFIKKGSQYSYRKVFSTPNNYAFDEKYGIQMIFDANGFRTYIKRDFADVSTRRYNYYLANGFKEDGNNIRNYKEQVFFFRDGNVYRAHWSNGVVLEEFIYLHFQKRNPMIISAKNNKKDDVVIINGDGIFWLDKEVGYEEIKKYGSRRCIKDFQMCIRHKIIIIRRIRDKYLKRKTT